MEGFVRTTPTIKKVSFATRGKFEVTFEDGRSLTLPLSRFPSLKKLPTERRGQYKILNGNTLMWPGCNEVYHVQDLFGVPEDYIYKG